MKRIIFSVYDETIPVTGYSVTDYKRQQFQKYKDRLKETQKQYAEKCGADYVCYDLATDSYIDLQYQKIVLFEQLAEKYDEIVYFDLDVVPQPHAPNIFETLDLTKINMYPREKNMGNNEMRQNLQHSLMDSMNVFIKICAKNSMLILDDCDGDRHYIYNTGIMAANKQVAQSLQFAKRLPEMIELLEEAKEDSIFPDEITSNFVPNNEVFMTYLVEKYNIPYNDLPMQWHFIVDHSVEYSPAGYLTHFVNKRFEDYFQESPDHT